MSSDKQKKTIAALKAIKEREAGMMPKSKEEARERFAREQGKAYRPQDRKYGTKGSDYKPGRRVQRPRAVPAIEGSIKEDIESA